MMSLRLLLKNLKYTFVLNRLYKKQSVEYEVLQISHRLEKGLAIPNKKNNWGIDKAKRLSCLLKGLSSSSDPSVRFSYDVGCAVLSKFIEDKRISNQLNESLEALISDVHEAKESYGGIVSMKPRAFDESALFKDVLKNRHSVRFFSDKKPDLKTVFQAVELANRCPSACNRQAFLVHVIDAKQRNEIEKQAYNAPYFLIITGLCSAYTKNEVGDAIVSSSIYAAYLSLTLNYYGIDACVIKKDIFNDASFNKKTSRLLDFREDEQIVLEIAIGFAENDAKAPVSMRKPASLLLRCHIKEDGK